MLSTVVGTLSGFTAGDSPVSTGWSSSDSSALACPTLAKEVSNTTKNNADPAGLRMCVRTWIVLACGR
jgi:hypothetical protein